MSTRHHNLAALAVVGMLAGCAATTAQRTSNIAIGTCANPLSDGVVTAKRKPKYEQVDLNGDKLPELFVADENLCTDRDNCYWNLFSIDTSGDCMPYNYLGTVPGSSVEPKIGPKELDSQEGYRPLVARWQLADNYFDRVTYEFDGTTYVRSTETRCHIGYDNEETCDTSNSPKRNASMNLYPREIALRPLMLPRGLVELGLGYHTWRTPLDEQGPTDLFVAAATEANARVRLGPTELFGSVRWLVQAPEEHVPDDLVHATAGVRYRLSQNKQLMARSSRWHDAIQARHHTAYAVGANFRLRTDRVASVNMNTALELDFLDLDGVDTGQTWWVSSAQVDINFVSQITRTLTMRLTAYASLPTAYAPTKRRKDPVTRNYLEPDVEIVAGAELSWALAPGFDVTVRTAHAPIANQETNVTAGTLFRF